MSLPRDVARLRRDQSTRARRSPRAGVPIPVRASTDIVTGTTDGSGEVTLSVTAPRGRVAVVMVRSPTHTGGTMAIPGYGQTVPGSPSGAFAQVVVPTASTVVDIDVTLYNAGGSPVSGRTVTAQVFAF